MIARLSILRILPGAPHLALKLVFPLLATAFLCLPLQAANLANSVQSPDTPLRPGSIQQQNEQQASQQRQEGYRKQLAIPDADNAQAPRDNQADLINGKPAKLLPVTPPPPLMVRALNPLLYTAIFLLAGLFLLRRFAPEQHQILNDRCHIWRLAATATFERPAPLSAPTPLLDGLTPPAVAETAGKPSAAAPLETLEPSVAFFARLPEQLASQRQLLDEIRRETDDTILKKSLANLEASFDSLKAGANFPGAFPVMQLASAAKDLLQQLSQNLRELTPSALRTLAECINTLERLGTSAVWENLTEQPIKFLVVDPDQVSRQALSHALMNGSGRSDFVVDGETALAHANLQSYDVIFMDMQMPDMNGVELCTQIRNTSLNHATPVIFVASWSDFNDCLQTTLCAGTDLIAKPFSIFEVTLKALTHTFEFRLSMVDYSLA